MASIPIPSPMNNSTFFGAALACAPISAATTIAAVRQPHRFIKQALRGRGKQAVKNKPLTLVDQKRPTSFPLRRVKFVLRVRRLATVTRERRMVDGVNRARPLPYCLNLVTAPSQGFSDALGT
jgi:hypothetical protein